MSLDRRGFLTGATAAAGIATLAGTATAHAAPVPVVTKAAFPTGDSLRVLVTGDAGTGARPQWQVADAARALHARTPFSLALALGDNVYENGPWSDEDAQFAAKFEDPNHGLDFPWLMVQGNHDNSSILPGDGGWLLRGDHEVAYHARSARWYMPARYYSVRVPEENPVVEFFVLDLNPIAAYLPPLFAPYWAADGQFMTEQAAWLDSALAASPATWKIACTHHPYLNNGPHGNAGNYEGLNIDPINGIHVQRFFENHVLGRCQFILSGHDHSLQVLDPTTGSKGTRQLISGAAAKSVHGDRARGQQPTPALYENYDDLGFMVLDLNRAAADLSVVTVDLATGAGTTAFQRRLS
ncbi:metallophosphoesterase [Nocardia otitidiscaviarum]|uniref:metallophosphoesterase n=1 Tax=Nocardia otitidiscaviarum TaxID=1823 RepID=UPI001893F4DD|nr:metallophosphoesterase [Nocardia otitidiscaviarum]MBF6178688.1 metallophosphoesterase [Nocardia otitidiscaviarum]